jgi:proline racemase/trans-L-3-hydroxyproline dehydratase
MQEKKAWFAKNRDYIRRMLMFEPRGHQDMFGAVITEPASSKADIGVIFMDGGGYLDMCGHGSMGVVTVILETGIIPISKKNVEKTVFLDTPAGIIMTRAKLKKRRVTQVTIRNVPSFVCDSLTINIKGLQNLPITIAYGGNYFALVKAEDLGLNITLSHLKQIKAYALKIREKLNSEEKILDPISGKQIKVELVEIYREGKPPRNVVVFGAGQIDRSPCGTGTCAKMAFLHAQNKLQPGSFYTYESILGNKFQGTIVKEIQHRQVMTIIPEVTGSAYITGFQNFVASDDDPYSTGLSIIE